MGYDVYLSFTADVPDPAVAQRLHNAFFTPDTFGPTLYVEWGDSYVYGTWEGRNCSEEDTAAILQPLAEQFGVTFDVTYSSDYDDCGQRFFVGRGADHLQAAYDLEKLTGLLMALTSKSETLARVLAQNTVQREQLIPLLDRFNQVIQP
jgi:hypothetical protein